MLKKNLPVFDWFSKLNEKKKKTITNGKNFKGGSKASNNLSSILLVVFFTIDLILFIIKFANMPLNKKASTNRIKKMK